MARLTKDEIKDRFAASIGRHIGYGALLSQKNGDQGDTAQRVGALFTLTILLARSNEDDFDDIIHSLFKQYPGISGWSIRDGRAHVGAADAMDLLRWNFGTYRRNPDPSSWGSNPDNLSRDQLSVLKMAMTTCKMHGRLAAVLIRQLLRFGFHQNTHRGTDDPENKWKVPDFITPGEIATYLRGMIGPLSIIPNLFFDLGLAYDLFTRKDDNWDVDNMLALNLLMADNYWPTWTGRWLMRRYLKTNFMARLWNYHKDEGNNGCEPLYWLFRLTFLEIYSYHPEDAP